MSIDKVREAIFLRHNGAQQHANVPRKCARFSQDVKGFFDHELVSQLQIQSKKSAWTYVCVLGAALPGAKVSERRGLRGTLFRAA